MAERFGDDEPRDAPRPKRGHETPLVLPGMVEYPPRPGWPHVSMRAVGAPLRRIRVSLAVVVIAAAVMLVIAYQVISGFLAMIEGFVN
ncbi:hypothetical protein [Alloactinosynnema sp. L-07]|uniref:hypothetical protein n=1 Tax=Alloactinosynnema sp. L-07 TaxID=1653480 RepID=UPI00065EFC36|nr:hypothetical protein [Alloactinosynnema sp. L-07]CRK61088.1 hypothetical protein [Alloactinosynnema sp. L-07]